MNAFIATTGLTARQIEYLKAELAAVLFRWKDALEGFKRAAATEGSSPTTDFLCRLQVPLFEIVDPNGIDALIEERTKSEKASYWYLLKANRLKDRGDKEGSMAAVKAALNADPTPDDLLSALECAGIDAISISEIASKKADKYPYTWRALLAKTMASAKSGVESLLTAIKDAEKYADGLVAFKTAAAGIYDSFLSELTEQGHMKPEQYAVFSDSMFVELAALSDDFGLNPTAWWEVALLGAKSERFWQIAKMAERHLKPATATNIDLTLCSTLMIIFANVGDSATTTALYKSALSGGVVGADAVRFYAVYLATEGKYAEAEKAINSTGSYTEKVDDSYLAFRAWLDAEQGRKKEAEAKLAKVKGIEFYGRAFMGLAYAALGDMEKATPILNESRSKRSWGYIYVHARAVNILDAYLRKKKDFKTTDQLAYEAAISQVANPMYAKFHYGETAGIKQFAGDYSWKVHGYTDEYTPATGKLSLKVDVSGAASGFFEDTEKHTYRISGKVDEFGNLKGAVTGEGKEWTVDAKLAPLTYYETFEPLRKTGQYFMLLDGQYRRIAWLALPEK